MPKSGKSKKSEKKKLKNMTDEERVLYMEQKMLLEAEAKRKKEELINELLKVICSLKKNTRSELICLCFCNNYRKNWSKRKRIARKT
jgi:hypothetical protein